jgi:antiviral helicase SKI2
VDLEELTCIKGEPDIENYYQLSLQEKDLQNKMTKWILRSTLSNEYLTPGRILIINSKSRKLVDTVGVLLKVTNPAMAAERELEYFVTTNNQTVVTTLFLLSYNTFSIFQMLILFYLCEYLFYFQQFIFQSLNKLITVLVLTQKPTKNVKELYRIEEVPLSEVTTICRPKIKIDVTQVLLRQNENAIKSTIEKVIESFIICSLNHTDSLTHSLTHSPTHSLTHSLTH